MSGEAQCLGLQHAYGGAPVAQFCQLSDAVIESGQLDKESVEFLLDWKPPSSVSLDNYGLRLPHAESLAYSGPDVPIFGVGLGIQRKRRSIGSLMTLSVPGYFRR